MLGDFRISYDDLLHYLRCCAMAHGLSPDYTHSWWCKQLSTLSKGGWSDKTPRKGVFG